MSPSPKISAWNSILGSIFTSTRPLLPMLYLYFGLSLYILLFLSSPYSQCRSPFNGTGCFLHMMIMITCSSLFSLGIQVSIKPFFVIVLEEWNHLWFLCFGCDFRFDFIKFHRVFSFDFDFLDWFHQVHQFYVWGSISSSFLFLVLSFRFALIGSIDFEFQVWFHQDWLRF